jgi:stage II sporulation protein P
MHPTYYFHSMRWFRKKMHPAVSLAIIFMLIFSIINGLVICMPSLAKGARGVLNIMLAWSDRDPRGILRVGVPILAWAGGQEDIPQVVSPGDLMAPLARVISAGRQRPLLILESQVPLLAAVNMSETKSAPVMAPPVEPLPDEEMQAVAPPLSKESLVAVYNTHTGETYALTDGMERLNGKRGGVVKAAEALEDELEEKYGIRVARSDAINDINYNTSYARSQETLRQLLEDNPSVQVVLDIHRDAGKSRENSLVTVDGQQVAPVLIIVGSDARAPFPTWRQNYDFARELAKEIEKQHPGLCLGVRIKEGRYNQFLHPRAVLLEVGSVSNSTEEAVRSARMLAGPVAEMVKRYMDGEV